MKQSGVIIAVIVVLALAGGILLMTKKTEAPSNQPPTTSNTTESTAPTPESDTPESANVITYTDDGFTPSTLTVKSGSSVTIKNNSKGLLQFDSNPHPIHTDDPELNVGAIAPGKSQTITVTKTGSHGYHNHLNDSDQGILVVE